MIPPPLRVVFALTAALSVAVAAPLYALGAQKYLNPQFNELTKTHKTIAILPFKVTIDKNKLPKNVTLEMVAASEKEESVEFQKQLYARFLQRTGGPVPDRVPGRGPNQYAPRPGRDVARQPVTAHQG